MKLSEAIEAIEDVSGGEYLKRIDAVEYTDWQDAAFTLYAEYTELKQENEHRPAIKISDGDVWLLFPNVMLSIEGICKYKVGPIVKRNLMKWRDALLMGDENETE